MLRARSLITASLFYSLCVAQAQAEEDKRVKVMERVTVIGSEDRRAEIPGSASLVGAEELERYQYTDVNRALRQVPGVFVQEEDGHGLRPNVAIRGGRSNRSADITLMEDGVLAAPSPYAAPEAYYFPQMDRMESLEIIKGAGAIKYGPRTTNGVLNMITKPLPGGPQADALLEAGSYETYRAGMTVGTAFEQGALMLNAYHKETAGFKDIDFVGGDTGYDVEDVLAKLRFHSSKTASLYQEVEFKLGYYDEMSNETYLGLTDQDFGISPNRRYGASQLDQMNADGFQASATHFIELTPAVDVTTTLYHNEFERSWYKLDGVRIGGANRSISAIFDNQAANAAWLAALINPTSAVGTQFTQRDNARQYQAQGVQSMLGVSYGLGPTQHKLEIGGRFHRDEEDRFQRDDSFTMQNGLAVLTAIGTPGAAGNRVQSAEAWSGFVQDTMEWGNLTVTPGVRFEHITLKRQDYGAADPARAGTALTVFESDLDVWIPGVGMKYALTPEWSVLAGVHKGFAPPGVPNNAAEAAFSSEEESTNYEIGMRYGRGAWDGEVIGFLTDYENLLGRDTLAAGGGGTGNTFNGGAVEVKGVEASLRYDAAALLQVPEGYRVPLAVAYTYIESEFKSSFVSGFEEWGTVVAGAELPYLPAHQLYLSAGLERDRWGVSISGKYVDDMRSMAGSGPIPESRLIDAHWVVDAAGEYHVTDRITAFTTVENLLDETYAAARRPAGLRPGMPLTVMAGVKLSLW